MDDVVYHNTAHCVSLFHQWRIKKKNCTQQLACLLLLQQILFTAQGLKARHNNSNLSGSLFLGDSTARAGQKLNLWFNFVLFVHTRPGSKVCSLSISHTKAMRIRGNNSSLIPIRVLSLQPKLLVKIVYNALLNGVSHILVFFVVYQI